MKSRSLLATFRNVACLLAIVLAGTVSSARADYTLTLSESGFTTVTINLNSSTDATTYDFTNAGGYVTFNKALTFGDYTIAIGSIVESNSPGTSTSAVLNEDIANITTSKNSASAVTIAVTSTGYNLPASPVYMVSSASGQESSSNNRKQSTVSYTATFSSGASSTSLNPTSGNTATSSDMKYTSSFSLTDSITISGLRTSDNDRFSQPSLDTTVYNAAPAPSSAILALAGLGVFGIVMVYRRRFAPMAVAA